MRVIWDADKASQNLRKHGVRFSDAELALSDPFALTHEDRAARGEPRFVSMGMDASGRVVVVIYTHRGDDLRLISARVATRREKKQYEEGIRLQ